MTWEAEYELLRAAYKGLAPALREIAEQEKEEAKRRTKSRQDDVKVALAKEFRRYVEAGMPRYVIQKVIGTNDWNTYKEWVRLGDIPTATDIKSEREIANAPFRWGENPAAENGYDFVLLKGPKGEDYPMRTGEVFFKEDRVWVVAPENDPERTEYLTALNNYPGGKDTLQRHMNTLAHAHRTEIGK
jgi:hypothetical protein